MEKLLDERLHFNVKVQGRKYSLKLTREEFAPISTKPSLRSWKWLSKDTFTDDTVTEYKLEWCEKYRELCLENFDINMRYFESLDYEEFNTELSNYLARNHRFKQIFDLNDVKGVYGYYIMVLDEYKQVYIGKATDILNRIRQHWNKVKPLDRTLLPMYNVKSSVFSIDFFRPLDTTRIFVWKKQLSDGLEAKLVKDFPAKFVCNRIGGDVTTKIEALATMNTRKMV